MAVVGIVIVASTVTLAWVVYRSERGVVLTVDTDKDEYTPGELVEISMQLKNYGFGTVDLVYGSSIIMWFTIYDSEGGLVFSPEMIGLTVITHVTLGPSETRDFGYVWNQVNDTGEKVELQGLFTVQAFSNQYLASATFLISD